MVSGFVSVLGPLASNSVFLSNYSGLWNSTIVPSFSVKESEKRLDLPPKVVVVDVHDMEEAISDDSVLNRSSTPPHAIEAIQVQLVRTQSPFSCFHYSYMNFFFFFLSLLWLSLRKLF